MQAVVDIAAMLIPCRSFGSHGSADGQLSGLCSVAVAGIAGMVVVTSNGNHRGEVKG